MIKELKANRLLISIHLVLFVTLTVTFILNEVTLYAVMFLINSLVLGGLYLFLLYMFHKILAPVRLHNLRVSADDEDNEKY